MNARADQIVDAELIAGPAVAGGIRRVDAVDPHPDEVVLAHVLVALGLHRAHVLAAHVVDREPPYLVARQVRVSKPRHAREVVRIGAELKRAGPAARVDPPLEGERPRIPRQREADRARGAVVHQRRHILRRHREAVPFVVAALKLK